MGLGPKSGSWFQPGLTASRRLCRRLNMNPAGFGSRMGPGLDGNPQLLPAQMEKNGELIQKADTVISSRQQARAKVGYAHNTTVTDDVFSAWHVSPQWNSAEIICLFEPVAPPCEGRETNDDVDPA